MPSRLGKPALDQAQPPGGPTDAGRKPEPRQDREDPDPLQFGEVPCAPAATELQRTREVREARARGRKPEPRQTGAGLELVWPGKYDMDGRRMRPASQGAHLVKAEVFGQTATAASILAVSDNLAAMAKWRATYAGRIDLIYVDPPFATGSTFDYRAEIGDRPLAGPGGAPVSTTKAFRDQWTGGLAGYLSMLAPRLELMHELLSPHGSFYLHLDPTASHAAKLLCDEIFGPDCFQREIVWRIGWLSGFKTMARNWIRNHDVILFYTKHPRQFTFNKEYVPHPPGYVRRDGNPSSAPGLPIEDVWNANAAEFALRGTESLDSIAIKSFSLEKTGYATQKNESLLRRIVRASSNPGDLVGDFFCGAGTTLVAAQQLDRRWIGCDANHFAVHQATKRLLKLRPATAFEVWRPDDAACAEHAGKVQFELMFPAPGKITLALVGYTPNLATQGVCERAKTFADFLDYWAVDWNFGGQEFKPTFVAYRTRRERRLDLVTDPVSIAQVGSGRIVIKTVDVWGGQTLTESCIKG